MNDVATACRFLLICNLSDRGCVESTARTCKEAKRREDEARGLCPLLDKPKYGRWQHGVCDIPDARELLPVWYPCHKGEMCVPRIKMPDAVSAIFDKREKPDPEKIFRIIGIL
jgi:hypothetical protein